jgi:hypothetical protein
MRSEVLTAARVKNTVFWVVASSLVEVYRIVLMMEAARASETSVNFYQTTRCNPEDSHLLQKKMFEKGILRDIYIPSTYNSHANFLQREKEG